MAYTLKPKIFKFFGHHAKVEDAFKDGQGKGLWERYQESLAEEYDDEVAPLVDDLLNNIYLPNAMLARLIPTMERVLGEPVRLLDDQTPAVEDLRRKMIQFYQTITNIRSTELSYEILIRMLGLDTVQVDDLVIISGFDSDTTFDDEVRVFDGEGGCNACREYLLITTGSFDISLFPEVLQGITRIVKYLEPINATLRSFTYNGTEFELFVIIVKIIDGVLYYDNTNDPGIILALEDGVLKKTGFNQQFYILLNNDGILYLNRP